MISMKKLLGSAAVLALAGNVGATTLFGNVLFFDQVLDASGNLTGAEQYAGGLTLDSASIEFTPIFPGTDGVRVLAEYSDFTYAIDASGNTADASGNPFLAITTTEASFSAFTADGGNTISIINFTDPGDTGITGTQTDCVDVYPGACDIVDPDGATLAGFNGFSLPGTSNEWVIGGDISIDPVAGLTISSFTDLSGFGLGVVRQEFQLFLNEVDVPEIPAVIPVPAAVWFFGSGLMGLAALGRKRNAKA